MTCPQDFIYTKTELRKVKCKVKKILSLILAGGLICSALLTATGCSDNKSGGSSSKKSEAGTYQDIFDEIKNCDVDSSGSSMRILQVDFDIKDWAKNHAELVSGSDAISDAGSEFSKYVQDLKDKEKTEFGIKCQAVIDADFKLAAMYEFDHAQAWGIEVQEYSDADIDHVGSFLDALEEVLVSEEIKPSTKYYDIDPGEDEAAFDKALFLELISSMAGIETATAGSSYELNRDTADFMQLVIDNAKCSEKDVKAGVKECYEMLSPSDKLTFDWNFTGVLSAVDELLENPTMITDMGISVAVDDFKKEDLNKLVKIISEVSGVTYTY